MGRAIDHENSIDELKIRLRRLENTVRGMVSKIDEIKGSSTGKDKKNVKKESNNEGSAASSGTNDSKSSDSKSKSSKSRNSK